MWTNEELGWKLDYEGLEYILTQIDPNDVEDENVAALLANITPHLEELLSILESIELEEL